MTLPGSNMKEIIAWKNKSENVVLFETDKSSNSVKIFGFTEKIDELRESHGTEYIDIDDPLLAKLLRSNKSNKMIRGRLQTTSGKKKETENMISQLKSTITERKLEVNILTITTLKHEDTAYLHA
jgi:hypothetical protein